MSDVKVCIGCGEQKDVKFFNRNQSRCIECQKIYKKEYRARKKQQKREPVIRDHSVKDADGSWCGTGDSWIY